MGNEAPRPPQDLRRRPNGHAREAGPPSGDGGSRGSRQGPGAALEASRVTRGAPARTSRTGDRRRASPDARGPTPLTSLAASRSPGSRPGLARARRATGVSTVGRGTSRRRLARGRRRSHGPAAPARPGPRARAGGRSRRARGPALCLPATQRRCATGTGPARRPPRRPAPARPPLAGPAARAPLRVRPDAPLRAPGPPLRRRAWRAGRARAAGPHPPPPSPLGPPRRGPEVGVARAAPGAPRSNHKARANVGAGGASCPHGPARPWRRREPARGARRPGRPRNERGRGGGTQGA